MIGVAWQRDRGPWSFIKAPNVRRAMHAKTDLINAGYHAFVFDRDSFEHAQESFPELRNAERASLPIKLRERDDDGNL